MSGEILLPLCGVALIVGLLIAAGTDLHSRIIPNSLNLVIALCAPIGWWAQDMAIWPDIAWQIAVAIGVFVPFLLMFNFGVMGGGDVKLIAALGLWTAPALILPFLMNMAILGGGVAAVMLVQMRMRRPAVAGNAPDASDEVQPAPEVPYGVAIAAAGAWAVYQQYINHFVG